MRLWSRGYLRGMRGLFSVILLFFSGAALAQVDMPYGAGGSIHYSLGTGLFSVYDHGRRVFYDMAAVAGG